MTDSFSDTFLTDYDYTLPPERIARFPLVERSASRLLYLPGTGEPSDLQIKDLPSLLQSGDVLVVNDTRVIKARLRGRRESGGSVEILVERIESSTQALVHLKVSNKPKPGARFYFGSDGALVVTYQERQDALFRCDFSQPVTAALDQFGELPIPPYFERAAEQVDETRYQTVFHDPTKAASVAAPTAGLHLDAPLLASLEEKGVKLAKVTLHVGAGTFQPVRSEDIRQHQMHSEWADVPAETVHMIEAAKAQGRQVIAVGTTATRALESAAAMHGGQLAAWSGETQIFIYPGFTFRVIDRLLTNFHLPQSSLLMLVSALAGRERIMAAYQHAIAAEYRFFSYGDAMLIDRV